MISSPFFSADAWSVSELERNRTWRQGVPFSCEHRSKHEGSIQQLAPSRVVIVERADAVIRRDNNSLRRVASLCDVWSNTANGPLSLAIANSTQAGRSPRLICDGPVIFYWRSDIADMPFMANDRIRCKEIRIHKISNAHVLNRTEQYVDDGFVAFVYRRLDC